MTLQSETVETVSTTTKRRTGITLLVVSLVVAVVAALGFGAWVYVDHHGMPGVQQQAITAVTAQIDASNAHDIDGVLAVSTDPTSWTGLSYAVTTDGPYVGDAFIQEMSDQYAAGLNIDLSGPMVALTDGSMVSVAAQVTFTEGSPYTGPYDGVLVFYLTESDGSMLVSHVAWMGQS